MGYYRLKATLNLEEKEVFRKYQKNWRGRFLFELFLLSIIYLI